MSQKLRYAVLTALLAAMIFLMTAYVLHIPVGTVGYVHLGDTMIFVAAALLPTPYAVAAAAIGGALADVLTGYAVYALPTAIIKSLMVLPFTARREGLLCRRNVLALVPAGLIGVAGYAAAETVILLLSGSALPAALGGAAATLLPNTVQETAGGLLFILLALALDRVKIKQRLA